MLGLLQTVEAMPSSFKVTLAHERGAVLAGVARRLTTGPVRVGPVVGPGIVGFAVIKLSPAESSRRAGRRSRPRHGGLNAASLLTSVASAEELNVSGRKRWSPSRGTAFA